MEDASRKFQAVGDYRRGEPVYLVATFSQLDSIQVVFPCTFSHYLSDARVYADGRRIDCVVILPDGAGLFLDSFKLYRCEFDAESVCKS